jgi:hypothetical protein
MQKTFFYVIKCVQSDGSISRRIESTKIWCEAEASGLIDQWNRQNKMKGYPKWYYFFVEVESDGNYNVTR